MLESKMGGDGDVSKLFRFGFQKWRKKGVVATLEQKSHVRSHQEGNLEVIYLRYLAMNW